MPKLTEPPMTGSAFPSGALQVPGECPISALQLGVILKHPFGDPTFEVQHDDGITTCVAKTTDGDANHYVQVQLVTVEDPAESRWGSLRAQARAGGDLGIGLTSASVSSDNQTVTMYGGGGQDDPTLYTGAHVVYWRSGLMVRASVTQMWTTEHLDRYGEAPFGEKQLAELANEVLVKALASPVVNLG